MKPQTESVALRMERVTGGPVGLHAHPADRYPPSEPLLSGFFRSLLERGASGGRALLQRLCRLLLLKDRGEPWRPAVRREFVASVLLACGHVAIAWKPTTHEQAAVEGAAWLPPADALRAELPDNDAVSGVAQWDWISGAPRSDLVAPLGPGGWPRACQLACPPLDRGCTPMAPTSGRRGGDTSPPSGL